MVLPWFGKSEVAETAICSLSTSIDLLKNFRVCFLLYWWTWDRVSCIQIRITTVYDADFIPGYIPTCHFKEFQDMELVNHVTYLYPHVIITL